MNNSKVKSNEIKCKLLSHRASIFVRMDLHCCSRSSGLGPRLIQQVANLIHLNVGGMLRRASFVHVGGSEEPRDRLPVGGQTGRRKHDTN